MSFKERVSAVIFPKRCCVCGTIIKPGESLCGECGKLRAFLSNTYTCELCGTDRRRCGHNRLLFERIAPAFFYEGAVRGSIARLKFRNKTGLAVPFAQYIYESMKVRRFPEDFDYITCIPMTSRQIRRRGYNQSELIARALSELTGIPYREPLIKLRQTKVQHGLPLYMRKGSLLGAFEVPVEKEADVNGKKVLIVDDVSTSGQTFNEAAKTLLVFGAAAVYCACFAMTRYELKKEQRR